MKFTVLLRAIVPYLSLYSSCNNCTVSLLAYLSEPTGGTVTTYPATGAEELSIVLAFAWPASSAMPTSACFSAPTSLPPSPHINTNASPASPPVEGDEREGRIRKEGRKGRGGQVKIGEGRLREDNVA
jgi:hypothetical protein